MKTPVYIKISDDSLDDFFIWKHKIEKSLGMDDHIPYRKFIETSLNVGNKVYMHGPTNNVIPFATYTLDDNILIFYVPSTDETNAAFFNEMQKCQYDISNVPFLDMMKDYMLDTTGMSFFTDGGKMRLIRS